jgi:spore maturation protein CgeB
LRILLAAMQWDYGFRDRGLSYEYVNFYDTLRQMEGIEVQLIDFLASHQAGGADRVRADVARVIDDWHPEMLFTVLFQDQFPKDLLAELRDRPDIITFNWFCDDAWRFDDFTRIYAPLFNACSTTSRKALDKYAEIGYQNVLKTQWGCNQFQYRPTGLPARFDVTFVGQPHGSRRQTIDQLSQRGIDVQTWGHGWEAGRLDTDAMIGVFSESRINLNFSNASVRGSRWLPWRRMMPYPDQVKGRNFEIPGCGGFQLSGDSEDLTDYFEPDREIVLFKSIDELCEAIQRYLRDSAARDSIASAGYRRTLSEHTFERRFRDIFAALGLG